MGIPWVQHKQHSPHATYSIYSGGQSWSSLQDQTKHGSQWNLLGSYQLDGATAWVMVQGTGGDVIADAVRFLLVEAAPQSQTAIYYFHNDHLGTPRAMSDSSGAKVWTAVYDPFGAATALDPDGDGTVMEMNLRFPGQYFDGESGLHYNYFRTYDPSTGRYLESDPIGLNGGLNTYGYAYQNPVTIVDPDGQNPLAIARAIAVLSCFAYDTYQVHALADDLEELQHEIDALNDEIYRLECTRPVTHAEEKNRTLSLVQLERAKIALTNERLAKRTSGGARALGIGVVCYALGAQRLRRPSF